MSLSARLNAGVSFTRPSRSRLITHMVGTPWEFCTGATARTFLTKQALEPIYCKYCSPGTCITIGAQLGDVFEHLKSYQVIRVGAAGRERIDSGVGIKKLTSV